MSKLSELLKQLEVLNNNIAVYDGEIAELTDEINSVVDALKDDTISYDSNVFETILAKGAVDLSKYENQLKNVPKVRSSDLVIDYSVTYSDLKLKETIDINGKQVNIYTSSKTDALYVISSGLNKKDRRTLSKELKNHLSNDQMAILTFNGDLYQYDSSNKKGCTRDYKVIGKTDQGKMYSLETTKNSEIVCDDGHLGDNDTLITTVNGMIIANKMKIVTESGAVIKMNVTPQKKLQRGQVVTEFTRLSFSCGRKRSTGNDFGTIYMEGDWQKYANTQENKSNGTWLNENKTKNVAVVGDGPQRDYPGTYNVVGHVDSDVIPIILQAGQKPGSQNIQGTVCYHHDGDRKGYQSKDMLGYSQQVVTDWDNI